MGYPAGPIGFDPEDNTFSGTVASRERRRGNCPAFRESIDSYLEHCNETGRQPDRPFNGKIPELVA